MELRIQRMLRSKFKPGGLVCRCCGQDGLLKLYEGERCGKCWSGYRVPAYVPRSDMIYPQSPRSNALQKQVQETMKSEGIGQSPFGRRCGISQEMLSRWLRARVGAEGQKRINDIIEAYFQRLEVSHAA